MKRTAALMGTANWVFNLCVPWIPYSSKLQTIFARLWIMVFTQWGHFFTDLSKAFDRAAHKACTLNNLSCIKERRRRHKTLDINQLRKGLWWEREAKQISLELFWNFDLYGSEELQQFLTGTRHRWLLCNSRIVIYQTCWRNEIFSTPKQGLLMLQN